MDGYTWDGVSLDEHRSYVYYRQVGDNLVRGSAFDERVVPNNAVGIEKSIHITLSGIDLRGFSDWITTFDGVRVDIVATTSGKKFAVSGFPMKGKRNLVITKDKIDALLTGLRIKDWYEDYYNEPFPKLVRLQDTWEG